MSECVCRASVSSRFVVCAWVSVSLCVYCPDGWAAVPFVGSPHRYLKIEDF